MSTMIRIASVLVLLMSAPFAWAQDDEINSLYDFLQGAYEMVGRWPDSERTYAGKVILKKEGDALGVQRIVNGKRIRGTGKIETATADKIKILRVRFTQGRVKYEATYLVNSDLDNYARLTGRVYLMDGGTKRPGLEALFIDPGAMEKNR